MTTRQVDVAVVGAGTAGLAAYRGAVEEGARAVFIEGHRFGTTCARVGCMPSKLLIAAAEEAYRARHAEPFGVRCQVTVDGAAVMRRLHNERDRFVRFVLDSVDSLPEGDRVMGHARFVEPGVLEVNGDRIEARAVVLATGSSPYVPPMFEAVKDRVVINDDVFAWEQLPESVAVFGTGVIGLEIGQALQRLDVRVHLFGKHGAVGPLTDPVVKEQVTKALAEELPFRPDVHVLEVRREDDGVAVTFEEGASGPRTESFAWALVAAGRRPNLAGLDLANARIPLDAQGVPVFDRATMQCGDTPVFVAGDAGDDLAVLHEAADEGRIAGRNAAHFPRVKPYRRRSKLAIVFSDPQIALVGCRFTDLVGRRDVLTGEVSFRDQGRSRVMLQNRGIARLYAERSRGRFLGAEIAGPRAEHLGHLLAWAHQQDLTVEQMLAMPFYHPVIEEGLRTALRHIVLKLGVPPVDCEDVPSALERTC